MHSKYLQILAICLKQETVAQNSQKDMFVAKVLVDSREKNIHLETRRKESGGFWPF